MRRNSLKNIYNLIEQATTDLPVEKLFVNDLKRSIELGANEGSRLPSKTYKPSSMNCIRNMYYQIIGATPAASNVSASSVGIANSGTDIHIRVQQAILDMKKHGIDCEYIDVADFVKQRGLDYLEIRDKSGIETKLYHKDLNMSFMTDGIIKYKGIYYILEIKTETSFKWNGRTSHDPKHEMQATAYSIAFGLPDVVFLYISRDVLDMKAYVYTPTKEMKSHLIGQIEQCDDYVSRFTCPPKPTNLPKGQCSYCGYREQCKKDGE